MPVHALLDSSATPNIMSVKFAKKLSLSFTPTNRRIFMANRTSRGCEGVVKNVPAAFCSIVVRLKFLLIERMLLNIIIGDRAQINMKKRSIIITLRFILSRT